MMKDGEDVLVSSEPILYIQVAPQLLYSLALGWRVMSGHYDRNVEQKKWSGPVIWCGCALPANHHMQSISRTMSCAATQRHRRQCTGGEP